MNARQSLVTAAPLRRLIAVGSTVLVLALGVLAACPSAHAWLHAATDAGGACAHPHGPDADASDAGCAVALFAQGVALAIGPAALTPPTPILQGVSPVTAAEFFLVSPRYLRQPERGPPLR